MTGSRFFGAAVAVVMLAVAPNCWVPSTSPTATPGMLRGQPAIAVRAGTTHLVYTETDFTTVFVRYQAWGVTNAGPEQAAAVPFQSETPSLAVGADGVVHVAYQEGGDVRYARRAAGGGWTTEQVAAAATLPWQSGVESISLDNNGNPQVVWQQGADIMYSRRAGAAAPWTSPQVVLSLPVSVTSGGPCPDIHVVNANGAAAVAAGCPGQLVYARQDPNTLAWVAAATTTFSSSATVAVDLAPAFGPGGDQVLWCDSADGQVAATAMVLQFAPGGALFYQPATTIIGTADCTSQSTGIASEGGTFFHGVYIGGDNSLQYVSMSGGTWSAPTTFCSGPTRPDLGAPGLPQALSVAADATGVYPAWAIAGGVRWTHGIVGSPGSICGWELGG